MNPVSLEDMLSVGSGNTPSTGPAVDSQGQPLMTEQEVLEVLAKCRNDEFVDAKQLRRAIEAINAGARSGRMITAGTKPKRKSTAQNQATNLSIEDSRNALIQDLGL